MVELLAQRQDEYGLATWSIKREISEESVIITTEKAVDKKPTEVVSELQYRNILPEYQSPFLNWENLIFCSNNYGVAPIPKYMHSAVQEGKKTAATVYLTPQSPEAQELICSLPHDCDSIAYSESMLFVFHKGCLADFFDFYKIKAIYDAHGVTDIDWSWVADWFQKPLELFADPDQCGFNLQSGGHGGKTVVTGLILGYPVESTQVVVNKNRYGGKRNPWVWLPGEPKRFVK